MRPAGLAAVLLCAVLSAAAGAQGKERRPDMVDGEEHQRRTRHHSNCNYNRKDREGSAPLREQSRRATVPASTTGRQRPHKQLIYKRHNLSSTAGAPPLPQTRDAADIYYEPVNNNYNHIYNNEFNRRLFLFKPFDTPNMSSQNYAKYISGATPLDRQERLAHVRNDFSGDDQSTQKHTGKIIKSGEEPEIGDTSLNLESRKSLDSENLYLDVDLYQAKARDASDIRESTKMSSLQTAQQEFVNCMELQFAQILRNLGPKENPKVSRNHLGIIKIQPKDVVIDDMQTMCRKLEIIIFDNLKSIRGNIMMQVESLESVVTRPPPEISLPRAGVVSYYEESTDSEISDSIAKEYVERYPVHIDSNAYDVKAIENHMTTINIPKLMFDNAENTTSRDRVIELTTAVNHETFSTTPTAGDDIALNTRKIQINEHARNVHDYGTTTPIYEYTVLQEKSSTWFEETPLSSTIKPKDTFVPEITTIAPTSTINIKNNPESVFKLKGIFEQATTTHVPYIESRKFNDLNEPSSIGFFNTTTSNEEHSDEWYISSKSTDTTTSDRIFSTTSGDVKEREATKLDIENSIPALEATVSPVEVTEFDTKYWTSTSDSHIHKTTEQVGRPSIEEAHIKIPKVESQELKNGSVFSKVGGFEELPNEDFVNITQARAIEAPHIFKTNDTSNFLNILNGKIIFLHDRHKIPLQFVQSSNGEIDLGIDGNYICKNFMSDPHVSILLSVLCNGTLASNL